MTPFLLAVPLVLAAPVPKEFRKATGDAEALVGTWEYVESSIGGAPAAARNDKTRFRFEAGGKCVLQFESGERKEVQCPLDPSGTPKRFQWIAPWGTFNGSYELTGDVFRMAMSNTPAGAAPAAVAPGPDVVYSVLHRVKE